MKNTMILYNTADEQGKETTNVSYGSEQFIRETWNPETNITKTLVLQLSGKTYRERKADAQEKAVEWSHMDNGGLYMGELCDIVNWFAKIGKQYGLLSEFRENCIC